MSRLTQMPSRVGALPARVRALPKIADALYQSAEWRALLDRVKAERGAWCQDCGSGRRIVGDHVVELRDGGAALDEGNVRLLCHACHQGKTARAKAARAARSGGAGLG